MQGDPKICRDHPRRSTNPSQVWFSESNKVNIKSQPWIGYTWKPKDTLPDYYTTKSPLKLYNARDGWDKNAHQSCMSDKSPDRRLDYPSKVQDPPKANFVRERLTIESFGQVTNLSFILRPRNSSPYYLSLQSHLTIRVRKGPARVTIRIFVKVISLNQFFRPHKTV